MKKFLKDLFYGPGNTNADLSRIGGASAVLSMFGAAAWNISLGLPVELGPTGFGGGLAAVLSAAAAWVYAKDRAKAENVVATTAASAEAKVTPATANAVAKGGIPQPDKPVEVKVVNPVSDPVPTTESKP